MRERCEKPYSKDYSRYGGRGIKVCERWQVFSNFVIDMGERPDGATLDRTDNNGNYSPKNCRWITRKEQTHNSKVAKLSMEQAREIREIHSKNKVTQTFLAAKYGVHQSVISRIINKEIW